MERGHTVESVDVEWFGKPNVITNIKCDYRHFHDYASYDVIVLLAGHSSVKMAGSDGRSTFKNNVDNFTWLLDRIKPEQKLIYASSSSVYSNPGAVKLDETYTGYEPTNFYDLSKIVIDNYATIKGQWPYQIFGLRFGTVNGYSPNLRSDIMINAMVCSYLRRKFIEVSNPHIYRPILWLKDLCWAMECIIQDGNSDNSGIYNLCSLNASVATIGRRVKEILGSDCDIVYGGSVGTPYNFQITCSKFCSEFGFNFNGSIDGIVNELLSAPERNFTHRNDCISYG